MPATKSPYYSPRVKVYIMMHWDMTLDNLKDECEKRFGAPRKEVERIIVALMAVN